VVGVIVIFKDSGPIPPADPVTITPTDTIVRAAGTDSASDGGGSAEYHDSNEGANENVTADTSSGEDEAINDSCCACVPMKRCENPKPPTTRSYVSATVGTLVSSTMLTLGILGSPFLMGMQDRGKINITTERALFEPGTTTKVDLADFGTDTAENYVAHPNGHYPGNIVHELDPTSDQDQRVLTFFGNLKTMPWDHARSMMKRAKGETNSWYNDPGVDADWSGHRYSFVESMTEEIVPLVLFGLGVFTLPFFLTCAFAVYCKKCCYTKEEGDPGEP